MDADCILSTHLFFIKRDSGKMIYLIFTICHFVLDWGIKGKWGVAKETKLVSHCITYTVGFLPVFLIFNVNLLWLIVVFVSHSLIDNNVAGVRLSTKVFADLKRRFPGRFRLKLFNKDVWYYVGVLLVDQLPHLLVLLAIIKLQ